MNLQFSRKELAAIISLASNMIMADGRIDEKEEEALAFELVRLGVVGNQLKQVTAEAKAMNTLETISIISNFTSDEKKYVTAFLGALMAVDGDIDDAEKKLWQLTSTLCNLPTMSIVQAVQIMSEL